MNEEVISGLEHDVCIYLNSCCDRCVSDSTFVAEKPIDFIWTRMLPFEQWNYGA